MKHWYAGIVIILLLSTEGCGLTTSLGHNPGGDELAQIKTLPNYKDGGFQNLESNTPPRPRPSSTPAPPRRKRGVLGYLLRGKREATKPSYGLPRVKTNLKALKPTAPTVVWFGHSSLLIKSQQGNVLIDPIFSDNAGPVPLLVRAFRGSKHYREADMPDIDVMIISHDHYDHMDYRTIKKLKDRVKKFVVPIGVGSHLRYWGIDPKKITELNWNESSTVSNEFTITATPAQHRSNRTFDQQNKTLWASYVIQMGNYKLFYSGDGGYGSHFKQIGDQYGPFDLAMLECGQYSTNWPYTHMMPEQSAQAAVDLKAKVMQPVHWAKFAESDHPWHEPMDRLLPAAEKLGMPVSVPHLGEPYTVGTPPKEAIWWEFE